MSFSLQNFVGQAGDFDRDALASEIGLDGLSDRERDVVQQVMDAVADLVEVFGGHLSASAYGHAAEVPAVGDTITININHVPDPAGPSPAPPAPSAVPTTTVSTSDAVAGAPLSATQPQGAVAPTGEPGSAPQSAGGVPGAVAVDPLSQTPLPPSGPAGGVTQNAPSDVEPAAADPAPVAGSDVAQNPDASVDPVVGGDPGTVDPGQAGTQADPAAAPPVSGTEGQSSAAPDAVQPSGDPSAASLPADPGSPPVPVSPEGAANAPGPVDVPAAQDVSTGSDTVTPPASDPAAGPVEGQTVPIASLAKAVYVSDQDPSQVDVNVWPSAQLQTEDGRALYYYSGDSVPTDRNGDGLGGVFHLYEGDAKPA